MPGHADFLLDLESPSSEPGWPALEGERGRMWCYGELLSYGAHEVYIGAHVLADWEKGRLRCERLNGRFVLLIQDRMTRAWEIITDRVGAMHCYALRRDGCFPQVASDPLLLDSARRLDWLAIASFFTFGFFLDDKTYFTDVQILLPRSVYQIAPGGILIAHRRYWTWHHTPDTTTTYDAALARYDMLLRQAVGRTARGRIVLPLSGGLDSRSLAAKLPHGTLAYSYGYSPDSVEMHIAGQIAAASGFAFTRHIIRPYLFDRLGEVSRALHGAQDVTQARQTSVNAWVRGCADAVLTGLWGDVWCDQMGVADGLPQGTTLAAHTLHKFQKRGHAWLLDKISGPYINRGEAQTYLSEAVEAGLKEFEDIPDPDFRVKAYKTTRWAFRWSNASLRGFALGALPRVPYYDIDLIDFFCTLPTAWVRKRRLQIDHLKRYAPHLARIRWQDADANLYLARYGYWLGLPRRALKKAHRLLTRQRPIERNWEVQLLPAREQLMAYLLRPGFGHLLPAGAVKALASEFFARPDAAKGYAMSMLLTFAAWLELAGV